MTLTILGFVVCWRMLSLTKRYEVKRILCVTTFNSL